MQQLFIIIFTGIVGGLIALFGVSLGISHEKAREPRTAVIVLKVDPSVTWQVDRLCAAYWAQDGGGKIAKINKEDKGKERY